MSATGRRAWLQIHLRTLVIISVVAGMLVLANSIEYVDGFSTGIDESGSMVEISRGYGWPLTYRSIVDQPHIPYSDEILGVNLTCNILVGLNILGFCAFAIEYSVIHDQARKRQVPPA